MDERLADGMPGEAHFQDGGDGADCVHETLASATRERFRHLVVAGCASDVPARPSIAVMLDAYAVANAPQPEKAKSPEAGRYRKRSPSESESLMVRCLDAILAAMRAAPKSRGAWWGAGEIIDAAMDGTGHLMDAGRAGAVMIRAVNSGVAVDRKFRGRKQWRLMPKAGFVR